MIKGSTVIMSDEYISELKRHRDICHTNYLNEDLPDRKEEYRVKEEYFNQKIDEAEEFQDTVESILNLDMPKMAVVKTINGVVLPLSNINIV